MKDPTKGFKASKRRVGGVTSRPGWVLALALALAMAGCISLTEDPQPGQDPEPTSDPTPPDEDEDGSSDEDGSDDGDDQGDDEDDAGDEDNGDEDEEGSEEDDDQDADPQDDHPPWPSPEDASIRPGVQISSQGGSCTSNFLYRTHDNASLMLGTAAHCFADAEDTSTNGCDENVDPLEPGAEVNIQGASEPGVLVYSSWHEMQQSEETNEDACRFNDFALVLIPDAERENVSPAVLGFGGPTGLAGPGDAGVGDKVLWYGSSSLRPGVEEVQANEGYLVSSGSWSAVMYGAPPGLPGDSGSGVLLNSGEALGVLNTVRFAPEAGANGVVLVQPALSYAASAGVPVELVTWELTDAGLLP